MKRIIAIAVMAVPLGLTSLAANSASAAEVLQPSSVHSPMLVAQRDDYRDENRRDDYRRNEIRREEARSEEIRRDEARRQEIRRSEARRRNEIRREDSRRTWIPGHWDNTLLGRIWIEGRWIYGR